MTSLLEKKLKKLVQKEHKLLDSRSRTPKTTGINQALALVEEKVPAKLRQGIYAAFEKSFRLIFEKGTFLIEKTYRSKKLLHRHKFLRYSLRHQPSGANFRALRRHGAAGQNLGAGLAALEGSALGLAGWGLPDIPLFTAMILRGIYRTSLSYGYNYDTLPEKYYLLLLIAGALAKGDPHKAYSQEIDILGSRLNQQNQSPVPSPFAPASFAEEIDAEKLSRQIKDTSALLADEMLVAKFVQGAFIIGAVGGITNFATYRKILNFAKLKLEKRFLIQEILLAKEEGR